MANLAAVGTGRGDIESPGHLADFVIRHASADVATGDVEATSPAVLEDLLASDDDEVQRSVLSPRHVLHEPRQRVGPGTRAPPHLVVADATEDRFCESGATGDISGMDQTVLFEEES